MRRSAFCEGRSLKGPARRLPNGGRPAGLKWQTPLPLWLEVSPGPLVRPCPPARSLLGTASMVPAVAEAQVVLELRMAWAAAILVLFVITVGFLLFG